MAKQGGEGDLFYYNGFDLSGDVGALSKVNASAKLLDVTAINKFGHERLYGERDGEISFMSYFNASPGQEHPALSPMLRSDQLATYIRGSAFGASAACLTSKEVDYKPKRGQDGALTLDTQALANGAGLVWGITATSGLRTDTVATNGTALDLQGSLSFGAEFYIQLTGLTGTDVTVKFQDSADNITFADIAGAGLIAATLPNTTFTFTTGNTATIRRYVRVATTTTGGFSSASFVAVIARNDVAGIVF